MENLTKKQNKKTVFGGQASVCPRRSPGYWGDNTSNKSAIKHFCLTENIVHFPLDGISSNPRKESNASKN